MIEKTYSINAEISITLTEQDVVDIMVTVLEGGIGYWACLDNTGFASCGKPASIQAAEELIAGGDLRFVDAEADINDPNAESWELTRDKFLNGVKLYFELGCHVAVEDNHIDTSDIDAADADVIIQLALFGEVIYG